MRRPRLRRRLLTSLGFLFVLMYLTMGHNMLDWPVPALLDGNHLGLMLTQMLLAIIVMLINRDFYTSGFKTLLHGAPNMDTLVALGSSVSFLWSLGVFYEITYLTVHGAPFEALHHMYMHELYFATAAMIPPRSLWGRCWKP